VPHYLTHSFAHQVCKFGSCSWEKKEERGTLLSVGYSLVSWFIVLALYWLSILRKFSWVSPPRGFPKINDVYIVIVFLSVILPMLLLSSKLKRNLIIAQNLTWYQS
jgi:hypothetical protein